MGAGAVGRRPERTRARMTDASPRVVTAIEPDPRKPGVMRVAVDGRPYCAVPASAARQGGGGPRYAPRRPSGSTCSGGLADEEGAFRTLLRALERAVLRPGRPGAAAGQEGAPRPRRWTAALERAAALGLLDDAGFALHYVETRAARGRGPARLRPRSAGHGGRAAAHRRRHRRRTGPRTIDRSAMPRALAARRAPAAGGSSRGRPSGAGWWPTWPGAGSRGRRSRAGHPGGARRPVLMAAAGSRLIFPAMHASEIRRRFLDYFASARATAGALVLARPRRRSDAAVHQRRDGAVQAHLPRRRAPRLPARGHLPEVRARRRQAQRPRAGGPHHAAPHLLRDAGQLLLRRLLQARRDRVRLGVRHQPGVARHPAGAAVRHGAPDRRRRRASSGGRSPGSAEEPHLRPRRQGQLLADGRHGPVRAVLRDLRGPRQWSGGAAGQRSRDDRAPSSRSRPRRAASSRSGTSSSCSSTAAPTAR